ncbi:hypothetical protein MVEN_00642400 [Mycena venus]|uniref:Uncharacterized protein n=1 Tax=Mycena venus TaxID=2733690 RepID=A0A8H6YS35_9AGAR|nr:hypothetical protein MVEN_00642400 [Mycena venus]
MQALDNTYMHSLQHDMENSANALHQTALDVAYRLVDWEEGLGAVRADSPLHLYEFRVFGRLLEHNGRRVVLAWPATSSTDPVERELGIMFQQQLLSVERAVGSVYPQRARDLGNSLILNVPDHWTASPDSVVCTSATFRLTKAQDASRDAYIMEVLGD